MKNLSYFANIICILILFYKNNKMKKIQIIFGIIKSFINDQLTLLTLFIIIVKNLIEALFQVL